VNLPGNQTAFLALAVTETPAGKTVRILPRDTGGLPATHFLEMSVLIGGDGLPISCFSRYVARATPHYPLIQEVTRGPEDADGKPTYQQRAPRTRGTMNYAPPLVTAATLMLFAGRLYDWDKGGEQSFAYLMEIGVTVPTLYALRLTADGTEEIALESGKVKARRLKYRAVLPHLGKEQQTGTLYVGPGGELLSSPNPFFIIPFKLKAPGTLDRSARTLELALEGPVDIKLRAKEKRTGVEAKILINNSAQVNTISLDPRLRVTRLESLFPGRKMTVRAGNGTLTWELEETQPDPLPLSAPYPLFFPQWFATEVWEAGNGPYADMKVGDRRFGTHPPVYFAAPIVNPFRVERLPDLSATVGGATTAIHHFRFTFSTDPTKEGARLDNIYDLYTDGRRLVALLGLNITALRDGWDAFTGTLKPPTPTPTKPAQP
jgi:hypothetical protein